MPLGLFRRRNLATANVVGVLWAAAMFAWFFLSALYLQLVLGYSPLQVGPGVPAREPDHGRAVARPVGQAGDAASGSSHRSRGGLAVAAVGLGLLARAPVDGHFVTDILPSMILLGFGAGAALNPLLLAAMGDVEPSEAGLASGVVNTSFMMGGALGSPSSRSVAASGGPTTCSPCAGAPHLSALYGRVSRRVRHRRRVSRCWPPR